MNNVLSSTIGHKPILRRRRKSKFLEIWNRYKKNKVAVAGLVIVSIFILVALFADLIVPFERATRQVIPNRLLPPSSLHWFGTDALGRDIFARVLHGTRFSLAIGIITTASSLAISLVIGSLAGYFSGKIDMIIMRMMDVLIAIPGLLLCIGIVAALGAGEVNLFIGMTIIGIPNFVLIIRTVILNIVNQEYIEACRACGTSQFRIIWKHVLGNTMGPIIVAATLNVSQMILNAATLSFIGLGFQPPTPEWGAMLNDAREFMRTSFYMMVFPGAAIILSTLSINLMGDGLRDALDPKLKD